MFSKFNSDIPSVGAGEDLVLLVVSITLLRLGQGLARSLEQRAYCIDFTAIRALKFILVKGMSSGSQAKPDNRCPCPEYPIVIALCFPLPPGAKVLKSAHSGFPVHRRVCDPVYAAE